MNAHSAMKTTSVVAATALGAVLIAGAPVAVSAVALGAMRQPTVVENNFAGSGSGSGSGGGAGQRAGQRSGQGMGGQRGQMQGMGQ